MATFPRVFFAVITAGCLILAACLPNHCQADVVPYFDNVRGEPTGEFLWDDFSGSYGDAHAPDQGSTGTGNATLTPVPDGGVITSTGNLYSLNTIPTWTIDLTFLETGEDYHSLAVQIATSSVLDISRFSLDGLAATEFVDLGQRANIGGFPYNFYWAEWQGVTARADASIEVAGLGPHEGMAGAKVTYFNTASSQFDISAVPEPGTGLLLLAATAGVLLRRRRTATVC